MWNLDKQFVKLQITLIKNFEDVSKFARNSKISQ